MSSDEAFDEAEHVQALRELWSSRFGSRPFERHSKSWGKLGFQGKDPVTDLRGAGMLGLRCLLHFVRTYPSSWMKMTEVPEGTEAGDAFPAALAGLNISIVLLHCLGLKSHPQVDAKSSPSQLKIFARLVTDEAGFEELFAISLKVLAKEWDEFDAPADLPVKYLHFPSILRSACKKVLAAAQVEPENVQEFVGFLENQFDIEQELAGAPAAPCIPDLIQFGSNDGSGQLHEQLTEVSACQIEQPDEDLIRFDSFNEW
jgi:hypothetical protein